MQLLRLAHPQERRKPWQAFGRVITVAVAHHGANGGWRVTLGIGKTCAQRKTLTVRHFKQQGTQAAHVTPLANQMPHHARLVIGHGLESVSYTHLDVYKRQALHLMQEAMQEGWQPDAGAGALGGFPGGAPWCAPLAGCYFNMRKTTIYGGSNEVQRNIVAQTVLG